jgi:hypothetical protein
LAFKIIAILHNTLLAIFIKLLETVFRNRSQTPDPGSTVGGLLSVSRLKSNMKGARFVDVAVIQERVTAVLRSIPKDSFADSFQ